MDEASGPLWAVAFDCWNENDLPDWKTGGAPRKSIPFSSLLMQSAPSVSAYANPGCAFAESIFFFLG